MLLQAEVAGRSCRSTCIETLNGILADLLANAGSVEQECNDDSKDEPQNAKQMVYINMQDKSRRSHPQQCNNY